MRAEPQLGPRTPVRPDAEQVRDELQVAPGVVLDHAADRVHRPGYGAGTRGGPSTVEAIVIPRTLLLALPVCRLLRGRLRRRR